MASRNFHKFANEGLREYPLKPNGEKLDKLANPNFQNLVNLSKKIFAKYTCRLPF